MSNLDEPQELVSLSDVSVDRGDPLLRRVNWRICEGELWAVVGRNGAGKSMLLRTLREELRISNGEAHYAFDEDVEPYEEIAQVSFDEQVHLVEEGAGYAQSRWHVGHDVEASRGRDVLGSARRTAGGRRLVKMLGLESLLSRRVTELSNGERRKLLLARAALEEPSILVLDNPFAGLDARSRRTLASAVRRLHRSGVVLVLLVARGEEILDCVTNVLFLERGRVVACGSRRTVLAEPRFRKAMRPTKPSPQIKQARVAEGTEPVIELRDVALRYGRSRVLESIDWVVRRGERWVVVGQNGAGKSALLSLVLAENPQAYANEVSLFGRPRGTGETIWEIRERLGCVSPELNLFHGRGQEAIHVVCSGLFDSIGLWRRPTAGELGKADAWLRRLGIARCADRRFESLSEGERQLVLLARALIKEPELLVLDEPCQGLDEHNRRRFLDVLDRLLNRTRATLIYITHDRDEVPVTATHGLILRRGRKVRQGAAEKVLGAYFRES